MTNTLSALVFTFLLSLPQYLCAQSGTLDTTFDPGTGVDLSVYSIAVQTNGQILIAGDFTSFNDVERVNAARLNADGSRDDGFNPGAAMDGAFPYANTMALLSSGQVLVGGSFTNTVATNFTRLNTNGSLDTNFSSSVDDTVTAIALQTNGSIVIGGFFAHVDGAPRTGIARLNADGSLDATLHPILTGGFSTAYALALQTDARIVVGGSFTSVNGTLRTNLARFNTDGSLDTNFLPVSVAGGQLSPASVYALAIDSQGRVLLGGDFLVVNGQIRTNLARLNPDGTLDGSFNPAAGTDFAVNSIVVEKEGKILLGGYFNMVNGVANNYVARLNSDGSLDLSFNTSSGPSDVVYSVALQPDGKVLIGGAFTEFNVTPRMGIARLQNVITVSPPRLVNPGFSNNVFTVSIATVTGKSYTLQFKNALNDITWTPFPPVAGDGTIKTLTDPSATVSRRFYRVEVQ